MRIPNINLTYEEVEKRHPDQLEKLIKKLRKSSSKMKDADPKGMTFEYNYAMVCRGSGTFEDLIREKPQPIVRKTVDEKVADWMDRCTPVSLNASIGRWWGSEAVDNPPELEESFRQNAEIEVAEEKCFDSRTPEEAEKETQELLRQLGLDSGFVVGLSRGASQARNFGIVYGTKKD